MSDIPFYLERKLKENIPELLDYLRPGMSVLDVGCGPGNLTLGVGQIVNPGKVIGIDIQPDSIQCAKGLASKHKTDNVSFLLGDVHTIDFAENSFDLVYSHTAFHSFVDPIAALKAQRRVTKPGGWVIAAGVRDWGLVNRYPPCPNWEKALNAWSKHDELLLAYHKAGKNIQLNTRAYSGRKCAGWFAEAGFSNLQVQIKPYNMQFHGSKQMVASPHDLLPTDDVDEFGFNASISSRWKAIFSEGLLDIDTFTKAKEERDQWYQNEHAFCFYVFVFIAGQV